MQMQLILIEDVPKLGEMGDIVKVAPGFGRNYLVPQGMAILATVGNKKELDHQLAIIGRKRTAEREAAQEILGELSGVSITITQRVSDEDALFGSVGPREIANILSQQTGKEILRKQIMLEKGISTLGIYKVPVKLASGVFAEVKVWIVAM